MLVLRALGLGDFLAGVPAYRALRRWATAADPEEELVLACPRSLAPLVDLASVDIPGAGRRRVADRLLDLEAKDPAALAALSATWRTSRAGRPRVAVNLHGRGPASHRALRALDPARLVGTHCPEAGVAGPPWQLADRPEEHETVRWCRVVATALGVEADPDDLLLSRPTDAPLVAGAVVVHPGAAHASRRWPPDRWATVAREAAAAGHRVLLTGGAGEQRLAEEVGRLAGLPPECVLAGRTGLAELAALVAAARLVVCGDTGVAHLASAFGTPSVVLFGPTSPDRWGPPRRGPHTVLWHGVGSRDPVGDEPDPALLEIAAEEVLDAVADRLDRDSRAARVRPSGERTTRASV